MGSHNFELLYLYHVAIYNASNMLYNTIIELCNYKFIFN